MQELIKITTNEQGSEAVSGRELHKFLEVKEKFTDWCKRMFEYGFLEKQDYILVSEKKVTKNNKNPISKFIDYALTLDTAKEIAMLSRTEKGKQARQYFIECERIAKDRKQVIPLAQLEILTKAIELNTELQKEHLHIKERLDRLDESAARKQMQISENSEWKTVADYAKSIFKRINIDQAKDLGYKSKMLSKEIGCELRQIRTDPRSHYKGIYPIEILDKVFREFFK